MPLLFLPICLVSCGPFSALNPPQSIGEHNSGYQYIPLDPLPITETKGISCFQRKPEPPLKELLASLPDNAVRIAIIQTDLSGKVSYGPVAIGGANNTYQVILDYINVDATNLPFKIISESPDGDSNQLKVTRQFDPPSSSSSTANDVTIPVYVGVGLRLTASVRVRKGTVNLASLAAIAASAEAGNSTGTLVVQTLGITGPQVSTALPLPSELNQTTVQNAIQSLGAIKALMSNTTTTLTPRVIGIYNPFNTGDAKTVNAIVSQLAKKPVEWSRPCKD